MPEGRILVVDDGKVVRSLMTFKLKEKGYTVSDADCGRAGLDLIAGEAFDLVILDVMLPDMSGMDILAKVRETHSSTRLPVIMATATDENEQIVRAFDLGANDYVTKPINFPVLFARIETHLRLKRAIDELERRASAAE